MRRWEISKFLEKSTVFMQSCYIIIMAVVFPLYMTAGGYSSVGTDKYHFFRLVTLIFVVVTGILTLLFWLYTGKGISFRFNVTAKAALSFLVIATGAWFFSSNRSVAWSGARGWFIGLETILFLVLIYVFISQLLLYKDSVWLFFLLGSGIAFFIGILNRFAIYPFEFERMSPKFITTLGQINWVAGYFSVMWPIGVGLYIFSEKKYVRYIGGVYTFLAMCLGIVQGSDSAFISFLAVFFLLLVICLRKWEKYGASYFEVIIGWCLACQLMRVFRGVFGRFTYGENEISGFLTSSNLSIYILVVVLIPYLLMKLEIDYFVKFRERLIHIMISRIFKKVVIFSPVFIFLAMIILIIVNTMSTNGIFGLGDSELFTFNNDWGSGRGLNFHIGTQLFIRMNPFQKLIGVGPDCFPVFLNSFPELLALSNRRYGHEALMNAHNEILTALVNVGILGTVAFYGIFITYFVRYMKKGEMDAVYYIPVICVFSYLLHNIVSFGQILNLPFIFMVMGIGESKFRKNVDKS